MFQSNNYSPSLGNFDEEEIFDAILKLEKSFGSKFGEDAFLNVSTFGELCDVFERQIEFNHQESCTSQQAFYKIREALNATQGFSENEIEPNSQLSSVFP